ncbi:maleylpyruvate isomerase family mycothiol-dependent enzyme [Thermobifida halotolerans]|uniref:Maleylpyruvate isomerase family mycothiol-dependent enzyme n=1 Tax=Thermobifida halotolerans TaxID=483545 RepID=A0A399G721_9ACTN|nr:maleylpyruvate isomerase family mycothiol-dependent enzyme [Thermobifida halotolerans]UOE21622.1 maleylpyruvate isomerase family mycothiol-dependent enzyme [Thermobifida halotolerans]
MDDFAWLGTPIDVRGLFRPEREELLTLLRSLTPDDWSAEAVPGWTVRDTAAHILGDDYGRLARDRDGYHEGPAPEPGEPLEAFIHRVNQQWVDAAARISPAALVDTLELTGRHIADLWRRSSPDGRSLPVSWAGADPAPLWLDAARDLTEYWTHRQQIRLATGRSASHDPRFLTPVLDTFMRALPQTLRGVPAPTGTQVRVVVEGDAGGTWTATAAAGGWSLAAADRGDPAAEVRFDPDTAWRLCTRGIDPDTAAARSVLHGDRDLAEAVCQILSIIR